MWCNLLINLKVALSFQSKNVQLRNEENIFLRFNFAVDFEMLVTWDTLSFYYSDLYTKIFLNTNF